MPAPSWKTCVDAALDKKATNVKVLDLRPVTTFADFFVLCSGSNQRQLLAIADSVSRAMAERGEHPSSVEGEKNAEWILMDFGDLVVHIFTETARAYYDLERLWRDAESVPVPA